MFARTFAASRHFVTSAAAQRMRGPAPAALRRLPAVPLPGAAAASARTHLTKSPLRRFSMITRGPNPSSQKDPSKPLTGMARLRQLFKDYGRPAIVVYFAISTVDLGISFAAVYMGVDVEQVVDWAKGLLSKWGLWSFAVDEEDEADLRHQIDEEGGKQKSLLTTFLIAYAFHKLLLPIRVPITVAVTPGFVRYMRRWGWMKDAAAMAKVMGASGAATTAAKDQAVKKSVGAAVALLSVPAVWSARAESLDRVAVEEDLAVSLAPRCD
ncbi:hypothetical protein BCR44DRAFT_1509596 [Catenaria anguillulae PL171]|uniref:DUF1279 domain-containing protein n=1 Tax=Catenaria anguillulae PL171 TaxID=765915 RepID=A0A1Y2I308_9FUNG|nr:hypothetical protein BCR44DRAFT_1509596 [Catenaria anguillulae PL171]